MAAALIALLSQRDGPSLPKRRALLIIDVQGDCISTDSKSSMTDSSEIIQKIKVLAPAFRQYGRVFWVQTERNDNIVSGDPAGLGIPDHDDDLFLSFPPSSESTGTHASDRANMTSEVDRLISSDDGRVIKFGYSAFDNTNILTTLRSRLVTELYICGCSTNVSVYATALDAARYGIEVNLIRDCLGYRIKSRHDRAIKKLRALLDAQVVTSDSLISSLSGHSNSLIPATIQSDPEAEAEDQATFDAILDDKEIPSPSSLATALTETIPHRLKRREGEHPSRLLVESTGTRSVRPRLQENRQTEPRERVENTQEASKIHKAEFQRALFGNAGNAVQLPWLKLAGSSSAGSRDVSPIGQNNSGGSSSASSSHPGLNAFSKILGFEKNTVRQYETMMEAAQSDPVKSLSKSLEPDDLDLSVPGKPLFGDDHVEASNGSRMTYDLLAKDVAETIFDDIKQEVQWQKMHHQAGEVPRLVCCQGEINPNGDKPVYRHPADQTIPLHSWTCAVQKIRRAAEGEVGHGLNHVLIQLYRSGNDFISEHSDKTLDIVPGSNIVNVSFGAQRTMRLRTKRVRGSAAGLDRSTFRVPLPHNSILTMTLETNAEYLHGINADKRLEVERAEAEKAYDGERISLTFRNIGTYLNSDESMIWGQGATGKTKDEAHAVINGQAEESEKLVHAFGRENQSSRIDWDEIYGAGSNVLHLK